MYALSNYYFHLHKTLYKTVFTGHEKTKLSLNVSWDPTLLTTWTFLELFSNVQFSKPNHVRNRWTTSEICERFHSDLPTNEMLMFHNKGILLFDELLVIDFFISNSVILGSLQT